MGWDQSSGSPVTPLDWDEAVGGMSTSDSRSPALRSMKSDMDVESVLSSPSMSRAESDVSDWMTDEAISERAGKWGSKVAEAVMRNSRRLSNATGSFDSARSFSSSWEQVSTAGSESVPIPSASDGFERALSSVRLAFVVCDARDPEARILYASSGFHRLTGYLAEEAVGRACWFLLEDGTESEKIADIRSALERRGAYCGTVVNYKKDGTPFWNLLNLSPISDDNDDVIKYFGMLTEVDDPAKKNHGKKRRAKSLMEDIEAGRSRSILASLVEDVSMSPMTSAITDIDGSGPLTKQDTASEHNDCFPIFRNFVRTGTEEATLRTGETGPSTGTSESSARITKARHKYSLSTGGIIGRAAVDLDRDTGLSQRHSKRYSLTISPKRSMDFRSRRSLALGSDSTRPMDLSASGKWSLEFESKRWRPSNERRYSMSVLEKDPALQAYLAVMPPETREWYSSMAVGSVVMEWCDEHIEDSGLNSVDSEKSRPLIWFLAAERSTEFEGIESPNTTEGLGRDDTSVSGQPQTDERKASGSSEPTALRKMLRSRTQRISRLQAGHESRKQSKVSRVPQLGGSPFQNTSKALSKFYRFDFRHRWNGLMKAALSQMASARQSVSYLFTPGVDMRNRHEFARR